MCIMATILLHQIDENMCIMATILLHQTDENIWQLLQEYSIITKFRNPKKMFPMY